MPNSTGVRGRGVAGHPNLCRWGDFLKGEGTNALGDPVTQKYMLGYTVIAVLAGVAVWAAVNLLSNHLL
jgi:hypothetical protein